MYGSPRGRTFVVSGDLQTGGVDESGRDRQRSCHIHDRHRRGGHQTGEARVFPDRRDRLVAEPQKRHGGDETESATGLLPVETVRVTSPTNATLTYQYDVANNNRQLTETDGLGHKTSFGYDTGGFEHTVVNPNGAMTVTGHDVRGNVVSSATCQNQASNACSTQYYSYYPDDTTAQLTTADPRNDLLLTGRDGRSASATDNTCLTSYTYDAAGDETGITTPPVAGFSSGRTTTTVFSDGTTAFPAADSGNVPKGLPVRTVSPGGAVNTVAYLHTGDIDSSTDAAGLVTTYTYDGLGQVLTKKVVSDTYPAGLTTTYAYDKAGQVVQESDPQLTDRVTGATHTATTTTVFDADGNVTSQAVADAGGGDSSRTETQTYDAYDHVATQSDANAAAGASNGNTITYTYDTSGNKTKEVSSAGTTTQYTYDDEGHLLTQGLMYTDDPVNPSAASLLTESSRAYDPAGRLASVTDSMGNTTSYTYTDNGLTSTVTKKDSGGTNSFVLQSMTYDAAGNPLSKTTDNGATVTNYAADAASRTTSTTVDPSGVDRVTSVSYTTDDQVATSNDHDSSGWDRTTTNTYDAMGNTLSQTLYGDASGHPSGWWKLDQNSGTTVTDASGTTVTDAANGVTWGDSAAAFAGTSGQQIATNGPVLDTTASYTVSAWVNMASLPTHNATVVAQNGTTNSAFMLQYNYAHTSAPLWSMEQTSADTTSPTFPSAYSTAVPTANAWTHLVGTYNAATGTSQVYVNGALSGSGTNTAPWSASGPLTIGAAKYNGNATDFLPGSVSNVQVYPRALSSADVTTLYGNGRTGGTVGSSDQQVTRYTYDKRGLSTSMTDADGNTTSYSYDEAGNLAVTTAPAVQVETDGGTAVTTRSVTTSGFNTFGEAVEEVGPNGDQTTTVYDANGNKVSQTLPPYTPAGITTPITATSTWTYDSDGNQVSTTTPAGETSSSLYDQLGDVAQLTAADGAKTHLTYDTNGEKLSVTDADGAQSQATYDYLGRPLTSTTLERFPSSRTLTATKSYAVTSGNPYGANLASATTPGGQTTGYGYNRAGDLTSTTDTAGNTTQYAYDADGQLTSTVQPGGVSTSMTYDKTGNLLSASGQGAEAATATRTFTYDNTGQVLTASTAEAGTVGQQDHQSSTSESFAYDDRGDLTSASGSAGGSSFTYNNDGSPLARTDAAGTTSYGYDTAGRVSSLNDATTGTNLTYAYNTLNQLASMSYGANGQTRTYTYNSAHDLTGDTLAQGGSTLAAMSYGYDKNGNLTSKTTTGVAGASANTYTYDQADRLASWNNGTATTAYGYDASGNRTQVGADVYTYDARDQLTSDAVHTYAYSARGTMTSDSTTADGTVAYGTDGFGNQITAGTHAYTLDATGRNITDADSATAYSRTFQYSGAGNTIASDGSYTYTYDPSGSLTGINQAGATSTSTGVLAVTDSHNDVVGTFTSGATTLTGSASYDPMGKTTANTALTGHLGFQSGWTEADTGKVGTASRWYDPATGTFMNKDTVSLNPVPNEAAANPFAYVGDNPLDGTDPSGHWGWGSVWHSVSSAVSSVSSAVSSSWNSVSSWSSSAWDYSYHYVAPIVQRVVHAAKHAYHRAVHRVRDYYHATVRYARRVYHYAARHVRRYYRAAVHAVHSAYHAVSRAAHRVVHAVKHAAQRAAHAVAHAARTAYHATVKAVKTAATYAKHHAAAITSFVVSTAVFAGCETLTAGVGSIGCAAAAGAAGSLVEQGFKCADKGGSACSVGSFAGSALEGAATGALGGALGSLGGKLLAKVAPKAMKAVGGLFGKGATEAEETAATDVTDQAASKAESEAAGSRSESGGSCPLPHSFTGNTRVLMANGTAKTIDMIRVGDTIANSVPGETRTQAHQVTAVIVTHTDHDFVDVGVKRVAKAASASAIRAVTKSALKKTAVGLAASAALLTTLTAGQHAGTGKQDPTTAPVAATSQMTAPSGHLTTTFHHPFYDQTQAAFTEAKYLHEGDLLQTPTGPAQVTSVRLYHANTTTYDLTIGTLHTCYVEAGDTPVLVHDCNTESVAADLDKMAYNDKTVGQAVRVNPDGSAAKLGQPLISGRSSIAEKVNSALEKAGVKMPSNGRFPAAEHPDTQFAYLLGQSKS